MTKQLYAVSQVSWDEEWVPIITIVEGDYEENDPNTLTESILANFETLDHQDVLKYKTQPYTDNFPLPDGTLIPFWNEQQRNLTLVRSLYKLLGNWQYFVLTIDDKPVIISIGKVIKLKRKDGQ